MDPDAAPVIGSSNRDDILDGLRTLALSRGVSHEEFDAALAEDRLDLLVVDRLVMPMDGSFTGDEVAAAAGMPLEQADRLWRALGFPEAADEAVFTNEDVDALRTIQGLADLGVSSDETAVQVTRVLGQSMARLADALVSSVDAARDVKGRPPWAKTARDDEVLLAETLAMTSEIVFPSIEKLIIHAWRRHIQAAVRRRAVLRREGALENPMLSNLTVGFADMVGFTALSSQLTAEALARVVDRFEDLAHSTVVNGGGRPVKMIGDEVMFVTSDPSAAVRIGLDLVDAYADDDLLSDVRVGLATGPVLTREGDFFGAVVNRAHRTVSIGDAGTVLCGEEVYDDIEAAGGDPSLEWEALKPRELKDIGRVTLWTVRRAGASTTSEERRTGHRWRRLSDISPELATLRRRGERALEALAAGSSAAGAGNQSGSGAERGRRSSARTT